MSHGYRSALTDLPRDRLGIFVADCFEKSFKVTERHAVMVGAVLEPHVHCPRAYQCLNISQERCDQSHAGFVGLMVGVGDSSEKCYVFNLGMVVPVVIPIIVFQLTAACDAYAAV